MPIVVSCPQCGRKLNAPDELAGKRVKCPQCSSAVQVPGGAAAAKSPQAQARPQVAKQAPAAADWYAEAADGTQHGPLTSEQVRRLVSSGLLDEFSRVRKQGTDQWQWLETAFPNRAVHASGASDRKPAGGGTSPEPASTAGERLHPCPDCGTMISRRAQQCPHCGCPVTVGGESPTAGKVSTQAQSPQGAAGRKGIWIAAGIVLALLVIGVSVFAGIQYLHTPEKQPPPPLPVAAAPVPPPAPTITAEQKQQWIDEVATATARELDELNGRVHSVNAMMAKAQEGINLIETLAQGKFPDPSADAATPQAAAPQAYQSQYEPLYEECRTYLQANLPQGEFDRAKVQETAGTWAAAKRAPLEEQLQKLNQQLLGP